jgi:hypothetical protein
MAKFGKSITDDDAPVAAPVVAPTPEPVVVAAIAAPPPPPVDNTPPPDFSASEPSEPKAEEHWMKSMWRPAMGWLYMVICFMDFVAFPAISMFMPMLVKGMSYMAWQSLTLSNGGLIHMAFGAILGVAAYGRTQEKVASKQ